MHPAEAGIGRSRGKRAAQVVRCLNGAAAGDPQRWRLCLQRVAMEFPNVGGPFNALGFLAHCFYRLNIEQPAVSLVSEV